MANKRGDYTQSGARALRKIREERQIIAFDPAIEMPECRASESGEQSESDNLREKKFGLRVVSPNLSSGHQTGRKVL